MSLQRFTDYTIEIDLPPLNGLLRKACVDGVPIRISGQQVVMDVSVSYVDDKGNALDMPGLSGYTKSLCAGMDTLVDMKTGAQLCDISEEYIQEELNPLLTGVDYGYQFEFMMMLMRQKVSVYDIVLLNLQQAAEKGKLD